MTTPVDKIKEHLNKWQEIDQTATSAPWKLCHKDGPRYFWSKIISERSHVLETDGTFNSNYKNDLEAIVFTRNNSAVHRDVISKLVEALEKIRNGGVPNGVLANVQERVLTMCSISTEALAECSEMLDGGQ